MKFSESLERNIRGVHGKKGAVWLERLPLLLRDCERRWKINLEPPFPELSYHYVAPARRSHENESGPLRRTGGMRNSLPVVLKAGVPCAEMYREIAALRCYAGQGSTRLIRSNRRAGLLLLERLEPGHILSTVQDDEQATRIAAETMLRLWKPLPESHPFLKVQCWADGLKRLRAQFEGGTGPLPAPLVERAEGLFTELFAFEEETVLLHGDLHHFNILKAGEVWKAIDPKGVAGERAYECGAWLRNPVRLLSHSEVNPLLNRRIAIFSEMLGIERERIRAWAISQAVLSAWWCLEDHGECWQDAISWAQHLLAA